jgi:hypothetical protein
MRSLQFVRRFFVCAASIVFAGAASSWSDTPDDPAYQGAPAWKSGENGGEGFLGWNLVSNGGTPDTCGFTIGDSRSLGSGISGINTPNGKAFGLMARGKDASAEAYRTLANALQPGQSVTFDLAVNFRSGAKGVDLRTAGDERRIFNFNVGADNYVIHESASGNGSVGDAYDANTIFKVTFSQTSPAGGDWKIERLGGISSVTSGTYEGQAGGLKFYVIGTDDSPENDLWINNLVVSGMTAPTPAP